MVLCSSLIWTKPLASIISLIHASTPLPPPPPPPLSPLPPSTPPDPCSNLLLCTEDRVVNLLSRLPSKTASGPDGISSWMLKFTAVSIAYPLQHIFNLSISSGPVPLDWKSSFVVPIPKSSPVSFPPTKYRPISILYLISKVLEKHVHSLLYDFCLSNSLISNFQFGFLPGRSTVFALLYSTHTIHSILDSNPAVCGVFLDLNKAFDSVPHQPLLASSLHPHLLNWIHSYLLNRSQKAVLNGSTSSSLHVSSGVPQGSILGPFLFLIYINGVTDVPLSPLTHLILYADDIFIFRLVNSPSDMSILQFDLNNISSWLTSHLLQLNSSKSKYIFFLTSFPHILILSLHFLSPNHQLSKFSLSVTLVLPSHPPCLGLLTFPLFVVNLAR